MEKTPVTPKEQSEDKSSSSSKKISDKKSKEGLTAVIRISGMVKVNKDVEEALQRLRLRRKYACVLIDTSKGEIKGMLNKVRYHVAYGPISKEVLEKLLKERGKSIEGNKKPIKTSDKAADDVLKGKKLQDLGLKPFFRLHPPRKGIKSKLQYPKGVLGNNRDDINKLIEKML